MVSLQGKSARINILTDQVEVDKLGFLAISGSPFITAHVLFWLRSWSPRLSTRFLLCIPTKLKCALTVVLKALGGFQSFDSLAFMGFYEIIRL